MTLTAVCCMTNLWLVFLPKYELIYSSHILLSACAHGLLLPCFWSVQFFKFKISQGSVYVIDLYLSIIANFPPSVPVKKRKTSQSGEEMDKSMVSCFFDSSCIF